MFGDKNKEPTEIFLDNEKIDLDSLPILSRKQLLKFNGTDDAKLYAVSYTHLTLPTILRV